MTKPEWRDPLIALLLTWCILATTSYIVYTQRFEPPSKSFRL